METNKSLRASSLFCLLFFGYIGQGLSAMSQNLPPTEQQIIQELDKHQKDLISWKCTGIVTEQVTQRQREFYERIVDEHRKRSGRPSLSNSRGSYVEHSYDTSRVFFTARKANTFLYAERTLHKEPKTYQPPDSTIGALDDIRKTGVCTITNDEKSYEVTGERAIQLQRNMSKRTFVPAITEGFFIYDLGMTPREAVVNDNFRYIEDQSDPKYGTVLVFKGKSSVSQNIVTFHLAPQFGYRVVYSERENVSGQVSNSHRVTSLVNIKGVWLPQESQDASYIEPVDVSKPDHLKILRFAHHTVNDVSDKILKVELKSGDYEWNEKNNTTYKVGANSERIFQDDSRTNNPRAMLPGWLYMASVTSLLVLTVLAYVRWKNKQWSRAV